ncbi:MAG: glycerophosphodiester phosphodiesterase, partial [Promethearchaeota archaeon]
HESPTGPVKEHTLAFLKAVKFPNNAQILTLKEFLVDVLDKFKLGTQIELKEGGYEEKILKAIEEANLNYEEHLASVVCTSFNYLAVRRLLSLSRNYNIPLYTHQGDIGLAFGIQGIKLGIPIFGKWFLRKCYRDNIWGGMTHYSNLPARRIEYGHKYHFHFIPRVPNDKKLVMDYIRHDVDGFETNNIAFIRECIKEAGYNLPPLPKI